MKFTAYITLAFALLLGSFGMAQKTKKLTAYLQTKQYSAPSVGNYLELHIQYVGYTINYQAVPNGLQGKVANRIRISQQDSIFVEDAFVLETPVMIDSIIEDFYDVQRFALDAGIYTVNLEMFDVLTDSDPVNAVFQIEVDELTQGMSISDILVAEAAYPSSEPTAFTKSGYEIIPRIATFFPAELNRIPTYFELYNTTEIEDTLFGVQQSIVNAETGATMDNFTTLSKHHTAPVVPVFKSIDISSLPTGTYTLNFTIVNRNMDVLAEQQYAFERSNDIEIRVNPEELVIDPSFQASITSDSVAYYLGSLIPISKPAQVRTIMTYLKSKDEQKMRRLMQAFWVETAQTNMFEAWMKYKMQVQNVEKLYATNYQNGYETDRGRVFLQYGSPSRTVARETSPSEYPYEIWEYNKIGVFSNKRFIFYNPDLINNNYRLLHSDMVGELKNPRWQYELNKRNTVNGNVDNPNEYNPNSWGNNSREIFGQ